MYKLKRNPLSQSLDFLFDSNASEKKYKYEFLVEFDKETPGYGIYYGCRAIIDESITSEEELLRQIDLIEEDMIPIKEKASEVLNKVFVSKKFNEQSSEKQTMPMKTPIGLFGLFYLMKKTFGQLPHKQPN